MAARILVVDDNGPNLELVEYLLRSAGHFVLTAADGAEGLLVAAKEAPDLVLCDLQMPAMNGYETLRALRGIENLRWTPVIALTAFSMPGDRARAIAAGFDGYLSKPIEPETFVAQVESFLRAGGRGQGS
jgi:CheY-like chemotaxis protein